MGKHTANFRVHKHHAAKRSLAARAPNDACRTGGFYKAPKIGDSIDALKPLTITWDPTCLDSTEVDIYLYAPGTAQPRVHVWQNAPISLGTLEIELKPRWWGAPESQNLQINIVPAGSSVAMSSLPAGPVFTATYTKPADGSTPEAADTNKIDLGYTNVRSMLGASESHMTSGKTAAAVLVPLLFIAACIAGFIHWKRTRGKEKRKKWTENVDKRMSTISADWKSVSVAGAQAAIRNSIAVSGNPRASSFSFGAIRPSSQFVPEGGDITDEKNSAGVGIRRPGIGLRNPAAMNSTERVSRVSFATTDRVSRVSFANDPRPSGESRRTKAFRDSFVPPVPALPASSPVDRTFDEKAASEDGSMSPRQTQGPITLTPEDIRSRIAAGHGRNGTLTHDEDMMPAISLIRTGESELGHSMFADPITPPATAYPKLSPASSQAQVPTVVTPSALSPPPAYATSPVMQSMPMPAMPAAYMSPDDMLRAYAERKKSLKAPITASQISYPMPVADTTGQRTLFSGSLSPETTGEKRGSLPQLGFAPGEYDANFDFGAAYGDDQGGKGAFGKA